MDSAKSGPESLEDSGSNPGISFVSTIDPPYFKRLLSLVSKTILFAHKVK